MRYALYIETEDEVKMDWEKASELQKLLGIVDLKSFGFFHSWPKEVECAVTKDILVQK